MGAQHEIQCPYDGWAIVRTRAMRQIVTHLRVSTDKQSKSDLGIEAQRDAVARFVAAGNVGVLSDHVQVETREVSVALDGR
jgi:hypothetical protein